MNGASASDAASMIQKSSSKKPAGVGKGPNRAEPPMTARMLKRFEPMTLPTATSACRRIAAITVVASSGSEVPMATMVRPIG